MTKHPWTFWAILIYGLGLGGTSFVLWLLGAAYPKSGWYTLGFMIIFLLLYWFDSILRADRDVKYQRHSLRSEVRREVNAELNKREREKSGKPVRRKVVDTEAEETVEPPLLVMVGTNKPMPRKKVDR